MARKPTMKDILKLIVKNLTSEKKLLKEQMDEKRQMQESLLKRMQSIRPAMVDSDEINEIELRLLESHVKQERNKDTPCEKDLNDLMMCQGEYNLIQEHIEQNKTRIEKIDEELEKIKTEPKTYLKEAMPGQTALEGLS